MGLIGQFLNSLDILLFYHFTACFFIWDILAEYSWIIADLRPQRNIRAQNFEFRVLFGHEIHFRLISQIKKVKHIQKCQNKKRSEKWFLISYSTKTKPFSSRVHVPMPPHNQPQTNQRTCLKSYKHSSKTFKLSVQSFTNLSN